MASCQAGRQWLCSESAALRHRVPDGTVRLTRPDGSEVLFTERHGGTGDAVTMGRDAGQELKRRGGPGFFTEA